MISEELIVQIKAEVGQAIKNMQSFQNVTKGVSSSGIGITNIFGGLAAKLAAIALPVSLGAIAKGAVDSAAALEMQQASFETMLGSADKARSMLDKLVTMAAKTPFQLTDLAQGTKTMLAFGVAEQKVLPYLQQIGDIAQGDSGKFQSLTLAFSQIQATGRLMGQDLLQLINAGFNPLQEISKKTGESMVELKARMEKGGISAQEVADAFKSATSEGGRFSGGMERASQTLSGLLSTAKDNLSRLGADIANNYMPLIKGAVTKFITFLNDNSGTIVAVFKQLPEIAKVAFDAIVAMGRKALSWETFKEIIAALATGLYKMLAYAISKLPELFVAVFKMQMAVVKNFGEYVISIFANAWGTIKNAGAEALNKVFGWAGVEIEKGIVPSIMNIGDAWDGMIKDVGDGISGVVAVGKDLIVNEAELLGETASSIGSLFDEEFDTAMQKIKDLVDAAKKGKESVSKEVGQTMTSTVERLDGLWSEWRDNTAAATENLDEVNKKLTDMQNLSITISEQVGELIGGVVEGSDSAGEAVKEFLKNAALAVLAALAAVDAISANFPALVAISIAKGIIQSLDQGGVLTEPVIGRGQHSGKTYGFALAGPEEFGGVGKVGRVGGGGVTVVNNNFNIAGSMIRENAMLRQTQGYSARQARGY